MFRHREAYNAALMVERHTAIRDRDEARRENEQSRRVIDEGHDALDRARVGAGRALVDRIDALAAERDAAQCKLHEVRAWANRYIGMYAPDYDALVHALAGSPGGGLMWHQRMVLRELGISDQDLTEQLAEARVAKKRRTIALDFDGVLHKYNGYQNGKIDGPIPGARDAVIELLRMGNEVVVFSTRPAEMIRAWLKVNGFPQSLEITNVKRPFYVIVDDRAQRFDGEWTPELIDKIAAFEPYWIKARATATETQP